MTGDGSKQKPLKHLLEAAEVLVEWLSICVTLPDAIQCFFHRCARIWDDVIVYFTVPNDFLMLKWLSNDCWTCKKGAWIVWYCSFGVLVPSSLWKALTRFELHLHHVTTVIFEGTFRNFRLSKVWLSIAAKRHWLYRVPISAHLLGASEYRSPQEVPSRTCALNRYCGLAVITSQPQEESACCHESTLKQVVLQLECAPDDNQQSARLRALKGFSL